MTIIDDAPGAQLPWGDPGFRLDPYPLYARVREEHPVYQDDDGAWVVSRYDDVMHFGKLPIMSIVEPADGAIGPWTAMANTVLSHDPPAHTGLRRHSNKWFTPKLVKEWVKYTAQAVNEALDSIGEDGVIDAHVDLGTIPTHNTMCRVMGLPDDDPIPAVEAIADAVNALSAVPTPEDIDRGVRGFEYMLERAQRMVDEKRKNPGEGMADALLAAVDRGELSERAALETITVFWASGGSNPAYLITTGMEEFARHPEVFHAYKSDPSVRSAIINEIVRLHPPELSFPRFPTEDVEIRGHRIPAGSQIRFMIGAANRDPEAFEHPEVFDYRRPPGASMNLSFGIGPHSCAGQVISRAEAEVIFTAIAERYDHVELVGEATHLYTDRARFFVSRPIKLS
ncbi:cytochrome P450 [Agromyces tropicus]|uniref:Cytochrome P450 n=1 Tax=Agromyces tropicus TaxID=555371 RepID=A0ABN2U2S3_9MICO